MPPEFPHLNPYGAPQAPVGDYVPADHALLERARSVTADRGVAWYAEAWRLFKLSPGVWIGIWAVFTAVLLAIAILPFIGGLIVGVVTPVFVGGTMTAARNAARQGGARFADLFASFSARAGQLLLLGLLQVAASFIAGILIALVGGLYFGTMFDGAMGEASFEQMIASAEVLVPMIVLSIAIAVIFVPITNAVWLASGLVALEGAGALDALRRGFGATFRNLLPLVVFALVTLALAVLATLPFLLGWLVLGPVLLCAIYAQFADLFEATGEQAQG